MSKVKAPAWLRFGEGPVPVHSQRLLSESSLRGGLGSSLSVFYKNSDPTPQRSTPTTSAPPNRPS